MDFVTAVKSCASKYATFSGRASRSEYWWFYLFSIIAVMASTLIDQKLGNAFQVALFLPSIAVGARRLHDIGKSGWWQLLLITIIGIPVVIYWYCTVGSADDNEFGSNPSVPSQSNPTPSITV